MATNDITAGVLSGTWLEGGYTAGPVIPITGTETDGFQWFWADERSVGYSEHFIQWAQTGQYKNLTFKGIGNGNYDIYLAGQVVGGSRGLGGNAADIDIGAEMGADANGQTWAHAQYWQYLNSAGTAWYPANPIVQVSNNAPGFSTGTAYNPTAFTVHTPTHACGTTPQVVRAGVVNSGSAVKTLSDVRVIASQVASAYGDATPLTINAVKTARGEATAIDGAVTYSTAASEPVYMVEETGAFSATLRAPAGEKSTRTGNVLHLTVSVSTGQVLDWSIQNNSTAARMKRLGTISNLK